MICWLCCEPCARNEAAQPLALGLHAAEHRLRILRRQVGALDAHVDDVDAEALGARLHLVADVGHQLVALVAHDVDDRGLRQRAAQRRIQHAAELRVGALDVEHRLIEPQRIGDPVAHEGVDLEPLVLGDQHLLPLVVEREDALVDVDDRVDERDLAWRPGAPMRSRTGWPKRSTSACSVGSTVKNVQLATTTATTTTTRSAKPPKRISHLAAPAGFCCSGSSAI